MLNCFKENSFSSSFLLNPFLVHSLFKDSKICHSTFISKFHNNRFFLIVQPSQPLTTQGISVEVFLASIVMSRLFHFCCCCCRLLTICPYPRLNLISFSKPASRVTNVQTCSIGYRLTVMLHWSPRFAIILVLSMLISRLQFSPALSRRSGNLTSVCFVISLSKCKLLMSCTMFTYTLIGNVGS